MPSYRRLQQYAIGISIASVLYNGAEGGVSIGFGAESNSRSLVFFGIQSGIEVISALLVVWRFRKVAKPGEERGMSLAVEELRFEKFATQGIGALLLLLALGTVGTAISSLVLHEEPDLSNASLIISASALVLMIFIWLPKRYLAKALDSSTMRGEATCSLSCIQLTCVLFVGSLIFRVWRGGWWIDSATSIVLALLFGWEGKKMVQWARDDNFTGGCCDACRVVPGARTGLDEAEMGEVYRDICKCCSEKEECRLSDECKCTPRSESLVDEQELCCNPVTPLGEKCCTREVVPSQAAMDRGQDAVVEVGTGQNVGDGSTPPLVPLVDGVESPTSACCEGCCKD